MESTTAEDVPYDWADCIAKSPPGLSTKVRGALRSPSTGWSVLLPTIQIWCDYQDCAGMRYFDAIVGSRSGDGHGLGPNVTHKPTSIHFEYRCRNCCRSKKIYAFLLVRLPVDKADLGSADEEIDPNDTRGHLAIATKVGEYPAYGPPVPSRVNKFLGDDRELFFKGRRSEAQGLGIGSFGYYRRVVENQKGRLLSQIADVASKSGAACEIVERLRSAANERQFSTAIKLASDAVPQSLLIDGHNPLVLLHRALSEGLHSESDVECLEIAHNIRVILIELAERISRALQEKQELSDAVRRLMQKTSSSDSN